MKKLMIALMMVVATSTASFAKGGNTAKNRFLPIEGNTNFTSFIRKLW